MCNLKFNLLFRASPPINSLSLLPCVCVCVFFFLVFSMRAMLHTLGGQVANGPKGKTVSLLGWGNNNNKRTLPFGDVGPGAVDGMRGHAAHMVVVIWTMIEKPQGLSLDMFITSRPFGSVAMGQSAQGCPCWDEGYIWRQWPAWGGGGIWQWMDKQPFGVGQWVVCVYVCARLRIWI